MPSSISENAIGVGLRPPHYQTIFEHKPDVDFFEITSENFLVPGGPPLSNLEKILSNYTVVPHGVSMGLGSVSRLDMDYLRRLKRLVHKTEAPFFSDHLCWTRAGAYQSHDLLPLPYTEECARFVASRAALVQDYVGKPFGIENLSSYIEFRESEMTEWEFFNQVIELSGCHYLVDINNIYVSSKNHGFDPREYLHSINWDKVLYIHIAGHAPAEDGIIIDTHDADVCEEVWELYRIAWELSGGIPTLLERDGNLPDFFTLWEEAKCAKMHREMVAVA